MLSSTTEQKYDVIAELLGLDTDAVAFAAKVYSLRGESSEQAGRHAIRMLLQVSEPLSHAQKANAGTHRWN